MHSSWIGLLLMAISITSATCGSFPSAQSKAQAGEIGLVKLNPGVAAITEDMLSSVEVSESKIGSIGELRFVQFVDPNNGWVADRMHVYRTVDGGKGWK